MSNGVSVGINTLAVGRKISFPLVSCLVSVIENHPESIDTAESIWCPPKGVSKGVVVEGVHSLMFAGFIRLGSGVNGVEYIAAYFS